jgi:hypothetical protein
MEILGSYHFAAENILQSQLMYVFQAIQCYSKYWFRPKNELIMEKIRGRHSLHPIAYVTKRERKGMQ